jgi:hypothetical protein
MQVKELIEILGRYDQEADVHFAYGYGDHWRTTVAPAISQVFDGVVQYSDYHQMDKLVEDDEDCYNEETGDYKADVRKVVVID